jgi:hypothetical protein
MNAPDLTQRPPRSPRVRLGGFVLLPRMLDKGRATLAGKNGEYKYNCPLDQYFTRFMGIDAEKLKEQLAAGASDTDLLEWVLKNSSTNPSALEVLAWSAYHEQRAPGDVESRAFFQELHSKTAPHRKDITTWFDLLDVDDFASFGGTP